MGAPDIRSVVGIQRFCWLTHPSETEDDSRRKSCVILCAAAKLRKQIIALDNAPVNSLCQFRIDASADRHRKRRASKSLRAEMSATKK